METWRDIEGYEGIYQVSNYGNVKSVDRISPQGHHLKERIRKQAIDKDGYCVVNLCKFGKVIVHKVHRLVAEAFITNPNNKPQVNHIDGNKKNNYVHNLEWVTNADNIIHAWRVGLCTPTHNQFYGEKNPHCKINDDKIRDLLDDYNSGIQTNDLVAKYGIGKTQIRRIVRGEQRINGSKVIYGQ